MASIIHTCRSAASTMRQYISHFHKFEYVQVYNNTLSELQCIYNIYYIMCILYDDNIFYE